MSKIATESGHYYWPDGTTAYTLKGKDGQERNTTIRDARRLGLVPSVTEVLKLYPKPALVKWMQKQVLMSALTLTRAENEADVDFMARIMADAEQQAENARSKGTAIHGAIERRLTGMGYEPDYEIYTEAGLRALAYEMNLSIPELMMKCEPEKSFASVLGYGGKVDLHSRELNFVCDFKTKEFDETAEKLAWDEHAIQLNAYAQGLNMPDARLFNVFISTSIPGLARAVEIADNREYHWQVFKDLLTLWKTIKKN